MTPLFTSYGHLPLTALRVLKIESANMPATTSEPLVSHTDVLIVGAGPAGLVSIRHVIDDQLFESTDGC